MINLVIISPFPPNITGIGQYGYHISRSLAESGQFKKITVLAGAQISPSRTVASPNFSIEYAWRPDQPGAIPAILSGLYRLKPDLVWLNLGASVFGHSPFANLIGFLSLSLIKASRVPMIVTLHEVPELADLQSLHAPGGMLARPGARLLTSLASQADVICLTMRRYVDWFSAHRPNTTCVYIPIGAYRPPELLPEAENPELLFFSSLAPYKGVDILLEAYRSLLPSYPALRLTVAGTGHPRFPGYFDELKRTYRFLPGVRWLGQVPEDQVQSLFYRAQMVVLPYTASTGSSSVMYQAAMWGRAVVASDLAEIRSVAEENNLEVEFYKNRDIDGLAKAIQNMLDSPASRKALEEHNYNAIQASRPAETARLYIQAFNQTLAAHNLPERIPIPAAVSLESNG
jgi:glycosyltransferase involved in cell wall biosynthesis